MSDDSAEVILKIIELAEIQNPASPFDYLLGVAIGGLQYRVGLSDSEIFDLVRAAVRTSREEAEDVARRVDAKRGSS